MVTNAVISFWGASINARLERYLKQCQEGNVAGEPGKISNADGKTVWAKEHIKPNQTRSESGWRGMGSFPIPFKAGTDTLRYMDTESLDTSSIGLPGGVGMERVVKAANEVFSEEDRRNLASKASEFMQKIITGFMGEVGKVCPSCQSPIKHGMKFCNACGSKLEIPDRVCKCGRIVDGAYCEECGAKYEG